jgi:5-formyltetrahydrofolate cyclo-ligase
VTAHGDIDPKISLRRRLLAARRGVDAGRRAARAAALTDGAVALAASRGAGLVVCAYLPVGSEPGSPAMLDALRAQGHVVLLPVVPDVPGGLDWAAYDGPGSLADGPLGLREPTGPRLGVAVITSADLVLVPALAVDRAGNRLGRGGGYYDRTLPLAGADTLVIAVVDDDELLDTVPAEPHDVRVAGVLRPGTGVTTLGTAG